MRSDFELMYELLCETQPGGLSQERFREWSEKVQQLIARVEGAQWQEHRLAAARLRLVSLDPRELYILTALLEAASAAWPSSAPDQAAATASGDVQAVTLAEIDALTARLRGEAAAPVQLEASIALRLELEQIRSALRRAWDELSLRDVASQVGLSPQGLSNFIDGAQPHRKTIVKLRAWMTRRGTPTE